YCNIVIYIYYTFTVIYIREGDFLSCSRRVVHPGVSRSGWRLGHAAVGVPWSAARCREVPHCEVLGQRPATPPARVAMCCTCLRSATLGIDSAEQSVALSGSTPWIPL